MNLAFPETVLDNYMMAISTIAKYTYDQLDSDAIKESQIKTDYLANKFTTYQFAGSRKTINLKLAKDEEGTGMIFIYIPDGTIDDDAILLLDFLSLLDRDRV